MSNEQKADTLKFDAIRAMGMGEFGFAIQAMNKAMELHPTDELHYYLAQCHAQIGDTDVALEHLTRFLEANPEHVLGLLEKAKVELGLLHYNEASTLALKAIDLADEEEVLFTLHRIATESLMYLGELDSAMSHVDSAIAINEASPACLLMKIQILARMERSDEAMALCDDSFKRFPDEERAWLYKGELLVNAERYDEAAEVLQYVHELDPYNEEAFVAISKVKQHKSGDEVAIAYLIEALDSVPNPVIIPMTLVRLYGSVGDDAKVAEWQAVVDTNEMAEGVADFGGMYKGGLF